MRLLGPIINLNEVSCHSLQYVGSRQSILQYFNLATNPKGTVGEGVFHPPYEVFLLITFEVESFSTGNFVTFPNIKCRIRTK